MTLGRTEFEAVALRYGFFYGPGTWFISDGDVGEQVRQQQVPIIGHGQGVWSWIHIDDAADATVRALDCTPGPYNIVDDNPSEQRVWLTAFARYCGALEPPHISERQALQAAGPDAVYYATQLRGPQTRRPNASLDSALVRFSGWFIRRGQLMHSKCLCPVSGKRQIGALELCSLIFAKSSLIRTRLTRRESARKHSFRAIADDSGRPVSKHGSLSPREAPELRQRERIKIPRRSRSHEEGS